MCLPISERLSTVIGGAGVATAARGWGASKRRPVGRAGADGRGGRCGRLSRQVGNTRDDGPRAVVVGVWIAGRRRRRMGRCHVLPLVGQVRKWFVADSPGAASNGRHAGASEVIYRVAVSRALRVGHIGAKEMEHTGASSAGSAPSKVTESSGRPLTGAAPFSRAHPCASRRPAR